MEAKKGWKRMELYRLKMGRPKKTDKAKKPSQVEGAGRAEDAGVTDPVVERNVFLMDGNGLDADNVDNAEASGSGLQSQGRTRSDTDDSVTDYSVDRVRKNLQNKRSRLVSTQSDEDDDEGDNDGERSSSEGRKRKKGKASAAKRDDGKRSKERREREKRARS